MNNGDKYNKNDTVLMLRHQTPNKCGKNIYDDNDGPIKHVCNFTTQFIPTKLKIST